MKTFYNQRLERSASPHLSFFNHETMGDLVRTRVKKLMTSNASTRMKTFVPLTCTSFLKLQFKKGARKYAS